MKRLLSITLALSLLGSSAAMAHGYPGGGAHRAYGPSYGYSYGYRDNNNAAALGAGILALGLFAALASQNNNDYYGRGYNAPRRVYGGYGYNRGYGSGGYRYGR